MSEKPRHPEKVNKPINPIKRKPEWIKSKIVDSKIDTFKNIKYFSYRRSIHLKYRDYGRNLSLVSII